MVSMNVFKNDAFSMIEMTEAIDKLPFTPSYLEQLGIFTPRPITTKHFATEERANILKLIAISQRGQPLAKAPAQAKRVARLFETVRLADKDTLYAHELEGVRAFGSETEVQTVQGEVANRLAGPTGLIPRMKLTHEHMRLGAINGQLIDADGDVVLDYYDEFGIERPGDLSFELDDTSTNVRQKATELVRTVGRLAGGALGTGSRIIVQTGDEFHDALRGHPNVEKTYLNTAEAKDLRLAGASMDGPLWDMFTFGGIVWSNYRGTDDGTTLAIPTTKARVIPAAPGIFRHYMSPAEFGPYIGTPGKDFYAMTIPDKDREAFVDVEIYSYPLFICTRPDLLLTLKID